MAQDLKDSGATTIVRLGFGEPLLAAAKKAASAIDGGICLRVHRKHLRSENIEQTISSVLKILGMDAKDVDLLVDFGASASQADHSVVRGALPGVGKFKTWTVAAGAFPVDLTKFSGEKQLHYCDREEWVKWYGQVADQEMVLNPGFADYTTQHGDYVDAPQAVGSYSVRYTLDDKYAIYRGHKPDKSKQRDGRQFIGHARMICSSSEFYGKDYSVGDRFIHDRTDANAKPGNAEQWRTAGINHHIMSTLAQLHSRDGTSTYARKYAKTQETLAPPAVRKSVLVAST